MYCLLFVSVRIGNGNGNVPCRYFGEGNGVGVALVPLRGSVQVETPSSSL